MAVTSPADFNLFDPAVMECPFPFYDALRREAPVYEVPGFGMYLVSRFDDIVDALRAPEVFSSDLARAGTGSLVGVFSPPPSDEIDEILAKGYPPTNTLLTNDPPSHTRYRALVSKAFAPRRVAQMEDGIRTLAGTLVDGFAADGRVELVAQYAVPLPLTVIADALGVPRTEMAAFKRWSDDSVAPLGNLLSYDRQVEVARSLVEFQHYFAEKIDERRRQPADDMLTDLVDARIDGEALSTPDLLNIVQQMLVAGNETTTKLIASAMLLLVRHPDAMAAVVADRSLIPNLVEEALRIESPVQGLFRVTTTDTILGGVTIPAGAMCVMVYGSGNRDDAAFPDAARFDLHRDHGRSHLAFGLGTHYCIGASLARAEARIAFEVLLDRVGDIGLAAGSPPVHEPNFVLRGLRELWLEFEPA
jgi:cytochrome P450